MAAIAVIFIAGIIAGITGGAILVVTLGVRREERDFSLTRRAPNAMSRGARLLIGLYVRHRSDHEVAGQRRQDIFV